MNYKGTLLVVSHDRAFLDNVVTSTYVLPGDGTVRICAGGYEEAARMLKASARAAAEEASSFAPRAEPAAAVPASARKLSYKETRELAALPDQIAALEEEIAAAERDLSDGAIYAKDPSRAAALAVRLPAARAELDAAETRWLELSERE